MANNDKYLFDSLYRWKRNGMSGWRVIAYDADIDTTASLVCGYASWAQIAANDTIQIVSSQAADMSKQIRLTGVDSAGDKIQEIMTTNSADGTTAVDSALAYTYLNSAYVVSQTAALAGNITVRRKTGPSTLDVITAAKRQSGVAQYYNGHLTSYITRWGVSNEDTSATMFFVLRHCNAAGTVVDVIDHLAVVASDNKEHELDIRIPAGSMVNVFGDSSADNKTGFAFIEGYDKWEG